MSLQSTRALIGLLIHDLVSPITALLGGLDCLAPGTDDQELLDCMRTSGETLRVLLDYLRLFSIQSSELDCALCFQKVERYLHYKHRATFTHTHEYPDCDMRFLPTFLTFVLLLSKTSTQVTALSCTTAQHVWTIEVEASSMHTSRRVDNALIASIEQLLHVQLKEAALTLHVSAEKESRFYIKTEK